MAISLIVVEIKLFNLSQDLERPHVKKSFDFVETSSSFYLTTKPCLIGIVIVVVEIERI